MEALADVPVQRALIARAAEGRDVLPDALRARGAAVDVVALYETVPEPLSEEARDAAAAAADYVLFTSASSVRFFASAGGSLSRAAARLDRAGDERRAARARRRAGPRGRSAHAGRLWSRRCSPTSPCRAPANSSIERGGDRSCSLVRAPHKGGGVRNCRYTTLSFPTPSAIDPPRETHLTPSMQAVRRSTITFLSDYGPGDEYVGVVDGVIATHRARQARVIHLGHGVPPQDVRTGSRRLARALPFTPPGVHLAVVDPGVGTTRRAIAIRAGDRILVGPDNGLLVPPPDDDRRGGRDQPTRRTGSSPSRHVPRPRHLRPRRRAPRPR